LFFSQIIMECQARQVFPRSESFACLLPRVFPECYNTFSRFARPSPVCRGIISPESSGFPREIKKETEKGTKPMLTVSLDHARQFILLNQGLLGNHRFVGKPGAYQYVR